MVNCLAEAGQRTAKGSRLILVVYEDTPARERVVRCSPHFTDENAGSELEIHWYPLTALGEVAAGSDAAAKATRAELIVFSLSRAGDLSQEVKLWIEQWIYLRSEREGAVVGLMDCPSGPGELACLKEIYLRHTAHRAGLDYLNHVPPTLPEAMPDSLDSYSARAGQMTSVLDQILHTTPVSPVRRL